MVCSETKYGCLMCSGLLVDMAAYSWQFTGVGNTATTFDDEPTCHATSSYALFVSPDWMWRLDCFVLL